MGTVKKTYASGVLDETRHFFYTEPSKWQVIEERVDSGTAAERQSVWGLRYVDDIVGRDRDTTGDGTLDERLYGMQDPNWNVSALSDAMGTVQERYRFNAYGESTVLAANYTWRLSSLYDWDAWFAGYRRDAESGLYSVRGRDQHYLVGWLQ